MNITSIKLIFTAVLAFSVTANSQIKNAKTEVVTVYGNCGMCEDNIETAGTIMKLAKVDWDKSSKLATITFDSQKTNKNEILKRIALAGYDSDSFLAPDDVYNDLHGCCQYDRTAKVATIETQAHSNHDGHSNHGDSMNMADAKQTELKAVFDNYFELKDALVNSNSTTAMAKASSLAASIDKVQMDKLEMNVHMVWMKVVETLKSDSKGIAASKDLAEQRKHFSTLSKEIYSLMKISNANDTVYYQFCPMANDGKGANWLSKESAIKNPYYGSAMMSCGKVVETIK